MFNLKHLLNSSRALEGSPVLFCHIPKTAGTSVRNFLQRYYSDDEMMFVYNGELRTQFDPDFKQKFVDNSNQVKMIYGHFAYGAHQVLDVEPQYVTLVRHPVDRVISLVRHLSSRDDNPHYKLFAEGLGLKDFIQDNYNDQTCNHMTKTIAGIIDFTDGLKKNDPEYLQLAKTNLDRHFLFAGTLDRLPQLPRRLGWKNTERIVLPHLNKSTGASIEISNDLRQVIEERNQLDLELYNYIQQPKGRKRWKTSKP